MPKTAPRLSWPPFTVKPWISSRDPATPITCSTDRLSEETSFNLHYGEMPDAVRLLMQQH